VRADERARAAVRADLVPLRPGPLVRTEQGFGGKGAVLGATSPEGSSLPRASWSSDVRL
jgi:hypothetical protein